jgi:hypothetical protein
MYPAGRVTVRMTMDEPDRTTPLATDHRRILDALGEPVLVIDHSFRIAYMNATARRRFGDPDPSRGDAFCHVVAHGSERPCHESGMPCPVLSVFETGEPARAVHFHQTMTGVFVPEEVVASPLRDDGGEVRYVIETARSAAELLETREVVEHMRAELGLLRGILPTCARCKRIRTADGEWEEIEVYVGKHSTAQFSHGLCPLCVEKLYPEFVGKKE